MPAHIEFAIWMGVLAGVLALAAYGIVYLRKWLLGEEAEDEDSIYTTAQIERLKAEGLLDDGQYERLKVEAAAAAKRRGEAAKKRKDAPKGLFG